MGKCGCVQGGFAAHNYRRQSRRSGLPFSAINRRLRFRANSKMAKGWIPACAGMTRILAGMTAGREWREFGYWRFLWYSDTCLLRFSGGRNNKGTITNEQHKQQQNQLSGQCHKRRAGALTFIHQPPPDMITAASDREHPAWRRLRFDVANAHQIELFSVLDIAPQKAEDSAIIAAAVKKANVQVQPPLPRKGPEKLYAHLQNFGKCGANKSKGANAGGGGGGGNQNAAVRLHRRISGNCRLVAGCENCRADDENKCKHLRAFCGIDRKVGFVVVCVVHWLLFLCCFARQKISTGKYHYTTKTANIQIPAIPALPFSPSFPPKSSSFPRRRESTLLPFCYLRESANGDLSPKMANHCGGFAAGSYGRQSRPAHSRIFPSCFARWFALRANSKNAAIIANAIMTAPKARLDSRLRGNDNWRRE